ncbi:hypothetical protein [Pyxidicoccus parkwayensis]|uniref:hypothetical protein n=1 Tax=Pyxidicoccus parkwayensis TaxID=2813578 RepID=UPI001F50F922|nr:hypothetical protein [Pyxidicoccus parkwaysis]
MSEPSSPTLPPDDEPRRSRSTAIAAVAALLLALPFLVLGLFMLDVKARIELRCEPGGPCVLTQAGYLTREEATRFDPADVQSVRVERTRSARRESVPIFRPEVETAQGRFPLFHQWATEESEATAVVDQVKQYLAAPQQGRLELSHDDRRDSLRVGASFTGVGVLLLLFSGWLALRARAHRLAEHTASR